jgi:hypothetical protein
MRNAIVVMFVYLAVTIAGISSALAVTVEPTEDVNTDTANLQAAFLAGGHVVMGAGTFKISGTGSEILLINKMGTYEGSGMGVTFLEVQNTTSSATDIIRVSPTGGNNSGLVIGGFTIRNQSYATPSGRHTLSYDLSGGVASLAKMRVHHISDGDYAANTRYGYSVYSPAYTFSPQQLAANAWIFSSIFEQNQFCNGVNMSNVGDSVSFIENHFWGSYHGGIEATNVYGANHMNISRNNMWVRNKAAIKVFGDEIKIRDNNIEVYHDTEDTTLNKAVVWITGGNLGAGGTLSLMPEITGNRITALQYVNMQGLRIENADRAVIANNMLAGQNATGAEDLFIDSNSILTDVSASNNYNYNLAVFGGTYKSSSYLPSQTGNSGKFLTTDGSSASWASITGGIGGTTGGTDEKLIRSDGTGGSTIQASGISLNDSNDLTNVHSLFMTGQMRVTNAGPTFQLYDTDSSKSANFAYDYDGFQIQRWSLGFGTYEASPFYFNLNAPEGSFWMNSTGNLGLGTMITPEKLTVNGNVQATSFIGDGSLLTGLTSSLPSQSGSNGKFLTTNGSTASWTTIIGGSTGTIANSILRASGTGGATVQNSLVSINNSGDITGARSIPMTGTLSITNVAPSVQMNDTLNSTKNGNFTFGYNSFQLQRWTNNFSTYEAFPFYFNILAPQDSFWMNSSGNLGLGTEITPEKLTVNGNVQAVSFVSTGMVKYNSISGVISGSRTLTNNAPTGIMDISLSNNGDRTGGTITYGVDSNNGTDYQFRTGLIRVSAVNKGGAIFCNIQSTDPSSILASSNGLLTENSWSCTPGIGKITIYVNFNSTLSGGTPTIAWSVNQMNIKTITPL